MVAALQNVLITVCVFCFLRRTFDRDLGTSCFCSLCQLTINTLLDIKQPSRTITMSLLSANLLIGTGILHIGVGLAVPELRQPFFRGMSHGFSDSLEINERYAREAGFWFELFGVLLIMNGFLMRSYSIDTGGKAPPKWMGWALVACGVGGVLVMPVSGFWTVIPQGVYILLMSRGKSKKQ